MMLAGSVAIAARAQPPDKGGNLFFPEKLTNLVSLRQIFTACILGALVICD